MTAGAALINGRIEAEEFIAVIGIVIGLVTGAYAVTTLSKELANTRVFMERMKGE